MSKNEMVLEIISYQEFRRKSAEWAKQQRTEYFTNILREYNGNVSQSAWHAAGMDRSNFYREIRKLGIDPEEFRKKKTTENDLL